MKTMVYSSACRSRKASCRHLTKQAQSAAMHGCASRTLRSGYNGCTSWMSSILGAMESLRVDENDGV